MITVWPNSSTAWRSSFRTSALAFESRFPVGSSAKTTAGFETSARATATRCCWPPESSEGRWVRRSSRPDSPDQLLEPLAVGLAPGDRERQHEVLLGGQDRQQVEELEDEAELVAAQLGQLAVVEAGDLRPSRLTRAGGRPVEPGEDVHQGRLARAGRPHDRREAVALEAGVDPDQGVDRGITFAVAARDVAGHHHLSVGAHTPQRYRYATSAAAAWRWPTNTTDF